MFFPIVHDLATELGVKPTFVLGEYYEKLERLSKRLVRAESVAKTVEALLATHRDRWEKTSTNTMRVQTAKIETQLTLKSDNSFGARHIIEGTCPACDNSAVAYIDVDYEDGHPVDAYVSRLQCFYCDLVIDDGEHIDYLKLHELMMGGE